MDTVKRDIVERTFKFGVRIVKMVSVFPKTPAGFALGGQAIRSGTSVGANIEEAQDAISRKEFIHSMSISLKESRETLYWLKIILESGLVSNSRLSDLMNENLEIVKILTAIVKNSRKS